MTILACDLKILAADSLFTYGDVVAYNRSKLRIIKQTALASCGDEEDSFKFEKWFFNQSNANQPNLESSYGSIVLSVDAVQWVTIDEGNIKISPLRGKVAQGAGEATPYAEALMREAKFNAHKAAEAAAFYDRGCGPPIYSITQLQLKNIDPAFDGFWIGHYKTPLTKLDQYLITYKQWLKT